MPYPRTAIPVGNPTLAAPPVNAICPVPGCEEVARFRLFFTMRPSYIEIVQPISRHDLPSRRGQTIRPREWQVDEIYCYTHAIAQTEAIKVYINKHANDQPQEYITSYIQPPDPYPSDNDM